MAASRAQRMRALEQFQTASKARGLTSLAGAISTSFANRMAANAELKDTPDLDALTADGDQMAIGIDLDSVRAVLDRLESIAPGIIREADRILEDHATRFTEEVREDWPFATGFSQSQWDTMRLDDAAYAVVNLAIYSGLIHDGAAAEKVVTRSRRAVSEAAAEIRAAVKRLASSPPKGA